MAEPEYEAIEDSEKEYVLKATATSDYARYEASVNEIFFKPTLMYTSRVYTFTIKNPSLIKIKYFLKIVSCENGVPDSGYYSVSP